MLTIAKKINKKSGVAKAADSRPSKDGLSLTG